MKDRYDEGADVNIQQVAQASEQYHFFDAQVIDAFNNVLTSEGNLRWLLGIASTDCRIIRPIDDAVMAPVEFDWCASLCEALTYRPELRQERWEIKKKELSLAYSKNGLLPELNVTALYRWLGLGNRYGTPAVQHSPFPGPIPVPGFENQSGALNNLYDGDYQEFQLGGEFRMPVGFRRELANVRNAQLKLAREVARLEDMELDVTRELSDAMRALATNQRIMHSAFSRWKDTTIEEDHFLELRDAGVETLDIALDSQRRRAQAELAFYTAICEYNKVIALIHRRKGTILPYNGICFAEGPWPGKAYMDASENARRRGASRQVNYGWSRPQVISRGEDSPTANNVGHQLGATPTVVSDGMYYPENSMDPGMPIMDGEIINTPYYAPGEIIEQVVPDTLPDPSLAPPSSGSSSRNVIRDKSIQQASFTEPAPKSKPAVQVKQSQPTRGQPTTQPTTATIKTDRPVRDTPTDSAKRLKAIPRTTAPRPTPPRSTSARNQGTGSNASQHDSDQLNRLGEVWFDQSRPRHRNDSGNQAEQLSNRNQIANTIKNEQPLPNLRESHYGSSAKVETGRTKPSPFRKPTTPRSAEGHQMNRWINLLTIGIISTGMFGCNMCCGPHDFDYATFGGKHQRSNPSWGRVGSVFSDPGGFGMGPSADSNLMTAADRRRDASDGTLKDDKLLEDLDQDLNEGLDMFEDLDRQLDEPNLPNPNPDKTSTEPATDETTASQSWRQRDRRPGQRWR